MGKTSRHLVIVRSVRDQHLTVAQAATRYGVSRQWVYTLLTRYNTHGVGRAHSTLESPHATPGALRQALVDQIINLRRELTAEGASPNPQALAHRPPLPATTTELQDLLDRFRTWYNIARPHRALARTTPATASTATPKATPTTTTTEWRTRADVIDPWGKVSLRYAGKLRHLGVGRAHIGEPVLMLIHDNHVITSNATTGQMNTPSTPPPTINAPNPRT